MSNVAYLAEQEVTKEEAHTHHWLKYIFGLLDNTFLGLYCRECEKFIPEESVARYVNELEERLKDARKPL